MCHSDRSQPTMMLTAFNGDDSGYYGETKLTLPYNPPTYPPPAHTIHDTRSLHLTTSPHHTPGHDGAQENDSATIAHMTRSLGSADRFYSTETVFGGRAEQHHRPGITLSERCSPTHQRTHAPLHTPTHPPTHPPTRPPTYALSPTPLRRRKTVWRAVPEPSPWRGSTLCSKCH